MRLDLPYQANLTREQFLFHEMRITARLLVKGKSDKEVVDEIVDDNLFQYPTERLIKTVANACIKRFKVLDDDSLVELVAHGSTDSAKQVCLYSMMLKYRIVWDFMTTVIGEKYRTKDLTYSKKDINVFFTRLQEQDDNVASWTDSTITKLKQVLTKILVENDYLDSTRSTTLNPVMVDFELKNVMLANRDKAGLAAFNYFE